MSYDLIVGVTTRNSEENIAKLATTIDKGLTKYFPKQTSLIICCDGFSTDKTKQNFKNLNLKNDSKAVSERGKRGKGSSIKTIFEKSIKHQAKATLIVEGDWMNFKSSYVKKFLNPILKGKAQGVIPNYIKDKTDDLINDTLVYPLTKSLLNTNIKHPLSGDHSLSKKAINELLNTSSFPTDSSVDLFINLTLLCENLDVVETKMGSKEHSSKFEDNLAEKRDLPKFDHVTKTLIPLIRYYRNIIKKGGLKKVNRLGKYDTETVKKSSITQDSYQNLSRDIINDRDDYVKQVYDNINKKSYKKLKIVWISWVNLYLKRLSQKSNEEARKELNSLVRSFQKHKNLLSK